MKRIFLFVLFILLVLLRVGYVLWTPQVHELSLKQVAFSRLPGWKTVDMKKSLQAFQTSCRAFLKQDPNKFVGSQFVHLQAKDWHPVCRAALSLKTRSSKRIQLFFQTWFTPMEFSDGKPVKGLFTGYYMPLLHGSLTKTKPTQVPLYGVPSNLIKLNMALFDESLQNRRFFGRIQGNQLVPFYTRAEINRGAIKHVAPVIAWIDSKIDRSFLEIQGSGIVQLPDGSQLIVGYAAQNGAPYTAIARVLIDRGVMTHDNASMQHIRRYLEANPEQMDDVLNQNKSFVFFSVLPQRVALGSQGVALTPGYSLAVDRTWVPMGVPIWLNTTRPLQNSTDKQATFQRLMIAQDTGGAIRGAVRGDVYWGAGERATSIAGKMKNPGHYWLLLPQPIASQFK